MTMLLEEPREETPPPPVEEIRACATCGAEMASDQDWCLSCGTAAPGRLGTRPGTRAAGMIVSLVLLLCGGAVAASYAALSDDASRQAAKPAGPSGAPVAQVPSTSTPAAPGATVPTIPTTPTAPTLTSPPITATPTIPKSSTSAPPITLPNSTSTPTISTPSSTTPSTTKTTKTKPTPSTSTKDDEPAAIDLPADSVKLYDPYARVTQQTDPADAYDSSTSSAYSVTAKEGERMGLGVVVDLEDPKAVEVLELATDTPGFRAEIYATDADELPPDILDTRWAHIRDRSRVDETSIAGNKAGDGKERIVLGGGSAKYRYYVLWLTTPPDAGPTVRLKDLELLG